MATFQTLVRNLRRAERQLQRQLAGVRRAISSLEFGGAPVPEKAPLKRGRRMTNVRKRRRLSAKARRAISLAQKKRWAKQKGAGR
jgi:hypothetical protein